MKEKANLFQDQKINSVTCTKKHNVVIYLLNLNLKTWLTYIRLIHNNLTLSSKSTTKIRKNVVNSIHSIKCHLIIRADNKQLNMCQYNNMTTCCKLDYTLYWESVWLNIVHHLGYRFFKQNAGQQNCIQDFKTDSTYFEIKYLKKKLKVFIQRFS